LLINTLLYNVLAETKTVMFVWGGVVGAIKINSLGATITMIGNATLSKIAIQDEEITLAARVLKAISHPLRLKILCILADREVSVQTIVEKVGSSQSNVSQHLAILRNRGILSSRKDANRVYYRVGDSRTLRFIVMVRELFSLS
jgi:DNA-binding transcriptional ArsR family regulator